MTDQGPRDPDDRSFQRPWEADEQAETHEETADVVRLPGVDEPGTSQEEFSLSFDDSVEEEKPVAAVDEPAVVADDGGDVFVVAEEFGDSPEPKLTDPDWEAMADGPSALDDFTSEEYLSATTQEYQGLAEEVSKTAETEWEQQAVAASLPGVESGLVGFEDVGAEATGSEESYEAMEQAASSDLTLRMGSAVGIFGLFLGSLILGGWWFSIFVILVMVVATGELYATVRTHGYRPVALFGLIGVVMMGVGAHNWGPAAIGGWAAVAVGLTVLFFAVTPRRNPLENLAVTVLGMVWVGMLAFAIPIAAGPNPIANILFLVLLVALNDMGAYFVGRAFGRRRLAANLSPGKTIEGFIGGFIVAAIGASVLVTFPAWESIGLSKGLAAAAVIGVLAPLGDIAESMVKRSINVKDMGSVLPGHGGMLDRIDGFLFAIPAVYILFRAFELL